MGHDAIVVGGSFAGLTAALQLARARRRVVVVDAGLPRNRFSPAAHGILGHDGRPPAEILEDARRQLAAYPTVEQVRGAAAAAHAREGGFAVALEDGRELRAARLVLATGVRDELPPIPGLPERWGHTVLHCPYCHGYEVAGGPLGVIATSPLASHPASLLPDWGPTTLFTQGLHEPEAEAAALLAARGVWLERTPVVELVGTAPALDGVRLADGRFVPLRAVFTGPRVHLASPLAVELGCAVEDGPMGPFVRVDERKATSVPGVFAAGDAASPMHNATLATAAGAMAGFATHQSLVMGLPVP